MGLNSKLIKQLLLMMGFGILSLSLVVSQDSKAYAQSRVQVLCDTTFIKFEKVRPLPGIMYRVVFPGGGQPIHQIERVTQTETLVLDIPLPAELLGKVFPRKVSPDGRYLALIPTEHNVPLVVWKIGTSELTTVLLSDSDVDYLNEFIIPTSLQERVLTWTDNNHILIQYFDLRSERLSHLLAEKILTIIDTPFQIVEGVREDIPYPNLVAPPEGAFPMPIFSPQYNYVILVSGYIGWRLQVYDMQSGQPSLVADLNYNDIRTITSLPLWTSGEEQFFILYEGEGLQSGIAQVNAEYGFQINDDIQLALEATFGPNVTIFNPPIFMLNDSGTKLVLRIYVPETQIEYLVIYQTDTGAITAICDDGQIQPQYYFPIWGPHDDYFGYWYNGRVVAYDVQTGRGYLADGISVIGWVGNP